MKDSRAVSKQVSKTDEVADMDVAVDMFCQSWHSLANGEMQHPCAGEAELMTGFEGRDKEIFATL